MGRALSLLPLPECSSWLPAVAWPRYLGHEPAAGISAPSLSLPYINKNKVTDVASSPGPVSLVMVSCYFDAPPEVNEQPVKRTQQPAGA